MASAFGISADPNVSSNQYLLVLTAPLLEWQLSADLQQKNAAQNGAESHYSELQVISASQQKAAHNFNTQIEVGCDTAANPIEIDPKRTRFEHDA